MRVIVMRTFDRRLAGTIGERVGMEVRSCACSDWLTRSSRIQELHSEPLRARDRRRPRPQTGVYASSTPVVAVTGEGIALIEARLPADTVAARSIASSDGSR